MNFILYIKCTEKQEFSYSNPFFDGLKKEIPNADFLDLDNFSGQELIELTETALQKASKSVVFFEFMDGNSATKFLKLATFLADNPQGKLVFINGIETPIGKLLFPMEGFSYHALSPENQLKITNNFINNA